MGLIKDIGRGCELAIVSGIPAGEGGTGRFISHLQEQIGLLAGGGVEFIARPERPARWQIVMWARQRAFGRLVEELVGHLLLLVKFWWKMGRLLIKGERKVMLLHPQNLGYRLSLRLMKSRASAVLVYLLDSSFFCIASYNHLHGANHACLCCLELGFGQAQENGCKPFPRQDRDAFEFGPNLRELVKAGRVRIAAQNARQAALAQRQFGLHEMPPIMGLWTQDWDEIFGEQPWHSDLIPAIYAWDVLFHGHCLDAKGAGWVAAIAALCPELRFMFPFAKPDWFDASKNCSFVPCSWETGLRNEIGRARLVIVPSLWSAPIEGALVKSIACAVATAVVENPTSFSDEIPDGVVLKLPAAPLAGAEAVRRACQEGWRPNPELRKSWLESFGQTRGRFVPELLNYALATK